MTDEAIIADVIVKGIQAAIAPFAERLAVLETKATDFAKTAEVSSLIDTFRATVMTHLAAADAARIPGPPGTPGPAGADGTNGVDGKDGAAGLRYLGVYVDGKAYALGDVVTWAGSAWHCHDTTTSKPGSGGSWQLIVKAGRDGRDRRVEAAP